MTTAETIQPALTAEEWKALAYFRPDECDISLIDSIINVSNDQWETGSSHTGSERHALAALALYGQPFGFTPTDVEAARQMARQLRTDASHIDSAAYNDYGRRAQLERTAEWWDGFADRIAALLPPK